MITAMSGVQVLGRREELAAVLADLQIFGAVEVAGRHPVELGALAGEASHDLGRIQVMLAATEQPLPPPASTAPDRAVLELFERETSALAASVEALRSEEEQLRHYVEVLGDLEALIPEVARLTDAELRAVRLAMVALLLDDPSGQVVAALSTQLAARFGDRVLLVSASASRVRGCLLVLPRALLTEAEALLSGDQISQVTVPEDFAGLSLHSTVTSMRSRLGVIPPAQARLSRDLQALRRSQVPLLLALRSGCLALVEREESAARADLTARTFRLHCWVPTTRLPGLRDHLALTRGAEIVVFDTSAVGGGEAGEPPVLLRNRPAWGPFERLVGFLSWPSPRGVDPTGLMAIALPFLFGVMVGDVVYGGALMLIGAWLRRSADRGPLFDDIGRVLLVGGGWSVAFGFLFGEALGSLGNTWGMPALWFYRGGPEALEPLLLFALALGAIHLVLGLALGVWMAIREGDRHRLAETGGTLAMLVGILAVVAALVLSLPSAVLWVAVAVAVTGVGVASASHGWLGLLLGPLEMLGTLGNVLSYLRLAAVGLASVYLANVANELAARAPLLLGLVVAALLHGLNLALAAFSPMVQALRLHYVEFFSKFHTGGGRYFTPLGAHGAAVPPILPPVDAVSTDSTRGVLVGDALFER